MKHLKPSWWLVPAFRILRQLYLVNAKAWVSEEVCWKSRCETEVKPLIVKRCNLVRPRVHEAATLIFARSYHQDSFHFLRGKDLSFVLLSNINYKIVNFAVN
jgi:hypothetical protein